MCVVEFFSNFPWILLGYWGGAERIGLYQFPLEIKERPFQ